MELQALGNCFVSAPCLVTQVTSGMIIGMLLFLVASGLTLILGVLNIVNFAHGSFYMLGAYFGYAGYVATGSYFIAILTGATGVAFFGIIFERLFMSRVYGGNLLLQILLCYAFVLILDDLVKIIWGSEYLSMGLPDAFRLPPMRFAGGYVPPFYLFIILMAVAFGVAIWLIIGRTRFGKKVRAAAENPDMVSALGIPTPLLYAVVFGLGSLLAGAAGALAAPVRSLTPGMGFSVLIESFIVIVIGGMGSVGGAFVAALLLGLTRAFGSIGFPLFVDGVMFLIMAVILISRPTGLFGKEVR